jgi:hypothetical protein
MSRGFFAKLTPEQQQAALEYRGPENIGGQTMTRTFTDEELDALAWVLRAGGPCPKKCRDMSPAGGCACGNAALAAGLREQIERAQYDLGLIHACLALAKMLDQPAHKDAAP